MARIVRCETCGGLYNESHLSSHQRLSHGKKARPTGRADRELDAIDEILNLYKQLSNQSQKEVLGRLNTLGETNP